MTHSGSIDVGAPVQLYDAFHAALLKHTGGRIDGLLARRLAHRERVRMIEVWTSTEARDRAGQEVIPQAWAGAHGQRGGTGRRPAPRAGAGAGHTRPHHPVRRPGGVTTPRRR
jgi:hypothetical protein